MTGVSLRLEKKADHYTVEQLTYRAFLTIEQSEDDEALLVKKLRSDDAFIPKLDFVAEADGRIVGNIMYSKSSVKNDDDTLFETITLGPVSVLPKYQRQGVGGALINRTISEAKKLGYRAVILFGHEAYYPRFGFRSCAEFGISTSDGKNFPAFMALPLYDGALDGVFGRFTCSDVFFSLDKAEAEEFNKKLAEPMDIDEYIAAQPDDVKEILNQVRAAIRLELPDSIEKISWQMPTFWQGENLIHFAAHKNHLGIYPGSEAMEHFSDMLLEYKSSKGAMQFPYKSFGENELKLISMISAWRKSELER